MPILQTIFSNMVLIPSVILENADWEGHGQDLLSEALAELDERGLDIFSSCWLADKKATLHELAERYNVSAERIRQLEQNAMKKLRAAVLMVSLTGGGS